MAPIKQQRDNRCQEFPARQLWRVTSNNGATSGALDPGNDCRFGHSGSPASKGVARQTGLRGTSWGQVTSGFGRCGLSTLFRGVSSVSRNADLLRPARRIGRVSRHPNLRVVGSKSPRVRRCEFQEGVATGEVSTLASHGITPVEHDDDNEHRPGINELRYVIRNNGDALSAGVPKFFMSVARHYRHQA